MVSNNKCGIYMMLRTCIELKNPSPANLRDMPCGNQPCLVGKSPLFTQEIIHQICKFRSFSIVRSDHQRLPTFSCFMLETNGPMAMAGSIRYLKTALPLQNTNLIQLMLENRLSMNPFLALDCHIMGSSRRSRFVGRPVDRY